MPNKLFISSNQSIDTPVIIFVYNRSDCVRQLMGVLQKVKPKILWVVTDGPKELIGEREKCLDAIKEVNNAINWKLDLNWIKSDTNLGCRKRMSSGITEVFNHVEEAIFLEDDCIPSLSFFSYCEKMLNQYRDEEKVNSICGSNYQQGKIRAKAHGYYFSRFPAIWGWATWKRVWKSYDVEMSDWANRGTKEFLAQWLPDEVTQEAWRRNFNKTYSGKIDSWDFQFVYTCWKNNSYAIIPDQNLVSNIGFREDATHTKKKNSWSNMPSREINWIKVRDKIKPDNLADTWTLNEHFGRRKQLNLKNRKGILGIWDQWRLKDAYR